VFWAELFSRPREFELNLALSAENSSVRALLLDVEGTTTPIDFVYKTLFPFASLRVEEFLRVHFAEAEIQALIADLRREHGPEDWNKRTPEEEIASASNYVRRLIEQDKKLTPLKALQGKIWEEGFQSGELRGEVYEDVPRAFARWKKEGKRVAIFSSGSVLAQKLLFAHSASGDLTKFIEAYFDTTTGPKREAASYLKIAKELRVSAAEMLFVSDVSAELDAAQEAGMETALSLRPGIARPEGAEQPSITSFDELFPAR
jgi:enolase-phosphatase E1